MHAGVQSSMLGSMLRHNQLGKLSQNVTERRGLQQYLLQPPFALDVSLVTAMHT